METNFKSETAKYREFIHKLIPQDCGVDIGSQGDPIVPWAMGLDLPKKEFEIYSGGNPAHGPIQLRGYANDLPFDDNSLGFVYSSHLLEDFLDWTPLLKEWVRVLKPYGRLIILIPDKKLWAKAIEEGQPPNCAHKHEGTPGELSDILEQLGMVTISDSHTNRFDGDYSIMYLGYKE